VSVVMMWCLEAAVHVVIDRPTTQAPASARSRRRPRSSRSGRPGRAKHPHAIFVLPAASRSQSAIHDHGFLLIAPMRVIPLLRIPGSIPAGYTVYPEPLRSDFIYIREGFPKHRHLTWKWGKSAPARCHIPGIKI